MTRISGVAKALCFITCLCLLASVIAAVLGHPRAFLLATITVLMALLMLIAQLSHRKEVRTLHGRGKRKGK